MCAPRHCQRECNLYILTNKNLTFINNLLCAKLCMYSLFFPHCSPNQCYDESHAKVNKLRLRDKFQKFLQ